MWGLNTGFDFCLRYLLCYLILKLELISDLGQILPQVIIDLITICVVVFFQVKPLHFYYQVKAKPSQTSVKKISSASEKTDCKRRVACGSRAEKLLGGACLKRITENNRLNMKLKGVIRSSLHKKPPKAAAKRAKQTPENCLALQIPEGSSSSSSRESSSLPETSPISEETKKLDKKSDLKENCRRKEDCDSQDGKPMEEAFLDKQTRDKSLRDFDSKEMASIQTKTSERNLEELTESDITDISDIAQKTSSRTAENEKPPTQLSPSSKKSADCSPSADSALSPSRPETVSQMTVDGFDTTSDSEGNAIDSASSPPPTKRTKLAEPNDRNLFAAIKSMIVNNNDNVVSSSTSSQASTEDSGDNKTSVETQTTTKLISRCSSKKGNKLRGKKDSSVIKSRPSKQTNPDARGVPPPPSSNVVALSADTSSQSISVTAHTYSPAVDTTTQQCTSATLCVPICIGGDKTGAGSNLILNLPQNVSVQCRIGSDKILIASNPRVVAAGPDAASTTVGSISYDQTTETIAESPGSQPSHGLTSQVSPSLASEASPAVTSQVSPTVTSQASPSVTSQASPTVTSQASPTLTSQAAFTIKSPAQPVVASSGQRNGSSTARTTVTSLAAPSVKSSVAPSVKSPQSNNTGIASPLPRQLNTRRITENNVNACNNSVTSAGECQASGKEVPVKKGAVKRTVDMSEASVKFRNKERRHESVGDVQIQSSNCGKSEKVVGSAPLVNPSPVRCAIPTRSPEPVLSNASALPAPRCEPNVCVVPAKVACSKSTLCQKEALGSKAPCRGTATDLDAGIRNKVPQNVATVLPQNPVTTSICKTLSRPKEMSLAVTATSVVSASSATVATPSGVSTSKPALFKPYQITTTTASRVTSPKCSVDGITTTAASFQSSTHRNTLCTNQTIPMSPSFQNPKDHQTLIPHQGDFSKAYSCMMRDSVPASPVLSCEPAKSGVSAVHRTMSNIPLHSVIKVPIYTARKMPQNKKSEKKGSRSPRNESSSAPVASSSILRKPELFSQETLGQKATEAGEVEGKLIDRLVSDNVHETPVSNGNQGGNGDSALKATAPKGIKNDSCLGKDGEGCNRQRTSSSIRSCLKLPLVSADVLDGGDSSSCSISTSSNEQSVLPAYESVPKTPQAAKKRFDMPVPSDNDHRHSPRQHSGGKASLVDEMSYTCAEADSGTSPGAVSLSPPRCNSKDDASGRELSTNQLQPSSVSGGASLRKKLVIDLERCSPRQGKSSSTIYTPLSHSTSLLRCCSPTTTTIPPADAAPPPPLPPGQTTPPRLVISLPRCQIPAPTTVLSPSGGCLSSQWSPTSSVTDTSPPTTKRLKLMCNGMTIYRTLESPGSRSPRRTSSGGGNNSRRSSPVSAPVVSDSPMSLLGRPSSCKSPSLPQGKCRRKSNSSAPAGVEPKVPGGDTVVIVSVDSTSTSPRSVATTVSSSGDNGLFTVMTPWKGHERVISLPEPVEEPLELTTKEVKERQKEREYAKLMSNQRPPICLHNAKNELS